MDEYYSTNNSELKKAEQRLISNNAETLITHVYKNKELYNSRELRVALAIKILLSVDYSCNADVLAGILEDLESLLGDENHLNTYRKPELRKQAISQELQLIRKFIAVDETLSLNR